MREPRTTPSQTVGPFFHPSMFRDAVPQSVLTQAATQGERIRIEGRIVDGAGEGVPDALVELWQANAYGLYLHPADQRDLPVDPAFTGFARSQTEADGRYWFDTIRPGLVPFDAERMQAPHINLTIFARGLLNHLLTRLYFEDEPGNASDPILQLVPTERRATLIAARRADDTLTIYTLDIVLQGERQTVFLNPTPNPTLRR
jgi:protocatechuate 3,4-dioxygenase alpha subunit